MAIFTLGRCSNRRHAKSASGGVTPAPQPVVKPLQATVGPSQLRSVIRPNREISPTRSITCRKRYERSDHSLGGSIEVIIDSRYTSYTSPPSSEQGQSWDLGPMGTSSPASPSPSHSSTMSNKTITPDQVHSPIVLSSPTILDESMQSTPSLYSGSLISSSATSSRIATPLLGSDDFFHNSFGQSSTASKGSSSSGDPTSAVKQPAKRTASIPIMYASSPFEPTRQVRFHSEGQTQEAAVGSPSSFSSSFHSFRGDDACSPISPSFLHFDSNVSTPIRPTFPLGPRGSIGSIASFGSELGVSSVGHESEDVRNGDKALLSPTWSRWNGSGDRRTSLEGFLDVFNFEPVEPVKQSPVLPVDVQIQNRNVPEFKLDAFTLPTSISSSQSGSVAPSSTKTSSILHRRSSKLTRSSTRRGPPEPIKTSYTLPGFSSLTSSSPLPSQRTTSSPVTSPRALVPRSPRRTRSTSLSSLHGGGVSVSEFGVLGRGSSKIKALNYPKKELTGLKALENEVRMGRRKRLAVVEEMDA